jgi:hypothetical protein
VECSLQKHGVADRVPEGGDAYVMKNVIHDWADMEMLVQAGARERTAGDYRKLYEQAGFQMTRVVPTAGPISLVEGKAV